METCTSSDSRGDPADVGGEFVFDVVVEGGVPEAQKENLQNFEPLAVSPNAVIQHYPPSPLKSAPRNNPNPPCVHKFPSQRPDELNPQAIPPTARALADASRQKITTKQLAMKASMSWLLLVVTNLLLPVGLLLFAKGFFPYKPFLPGLAKFDGGVSSAPKMFDKVVFMVVDALRRYTAFN